MDSLFKTHWSGSNGHPSEDELLLFVDGELPARVTGGVRNHLEACWSCRVRTEKIQETISSFIDYRNSVLRPLVASPPHGWRRFDGKLRGLVAEVGRPSLFASVLGTLSRIFSAPQFSITWERGRLASIFSIDSTVLLRAVTAAFVVSLLAIALLYLNRAPVVSASEVLQRATEAQEQQIRATAQAVVYQKLRVRRTARASKEAETLTWEVWNDTARARVRQSVEHSGSRQLLDISDEISTNHPVSVKPQASLPAALITLEKAMRSNRMNPARPLSAASYDVWRRSVEPRYEEVTKTQLADGHEALTVKTIATGQVTVGAIVEASIVVRASDWHPVGERLRMKGEQEDEEFELTETAHSVVSLSSLNPEIFPEPVAVSSPPNKPAELAKTEAVPYPAPGRKHLIPAATAELEVEVLRLLSEARADLGEQVSLTRTAEGKLLVQGIVDTKERKTEILKALKPIKSNPSIKVEISTVSEALGRQKPPASSSTTVKQIEVAEGSTIPVYGDLREYFSARGIPSDRMDEEVRHYSNRVLSRSRQALRHAWALKRLAERFTPEDLNALSAEAQAKRLAMIRQHAQAFQQETEKLRLELQPIFFRSGLTSEANSEMEINNESDLIRALARLAELASTNDEAMRSAFTISAGSATFSIIKTPQFSRSLASAEKLAARIRAQTERSPYNQQ